MMKELIRIVAFFKQKRNVTRGISSAIYKVIKQQYKEELACAEVEIARVKEMSLKTKFTKEDIAFCMPFMELIYTWKKKQEDNYLQIV